MSFVNPLREGGKSQPPPLVSPRSHSDGPLRSSKSNDSGLFRPFDSHQMMNGYDSHSRRDRGDNSAVSKVDSEDKRSVQERHLMDRKYDKDSSETVLKTGSPASAFQAFANHISKMESDAKILSHSVSRDAFSIPHSVYSTPLNVPSYNTSLIQSNLQRCDPISGTDYMKSSIKESQNCVSKLDLEEKRKTESRKNVCCSDSECDYSNEEEDQGKQLLIASGPPLKLDTSPKKIKLLSELGLTTFSNKKGKLWKFLKEKVTVAFLKNNKLAGKTECLYLHIKLYIINLLPAQSNCVSLYDSVDHDHPEHPCSEILICIVHCAVISTSMNNNCYFAY